MADAIIPDDPVLNAEPIELQTKKEAEARALLLHAHRHALNQRTLRFAAIYAHAYEPTSDQAVKLAQAAAAAIAEKLVQNAANAFLARQSASSMNKERNTAPRIQARDVITSLERAGLPVPVCTTGGRSYDCPADVDRKREKKAKDAAAAQAENEPEAKPVSKRSRVAAA